jgi:CheY-like chemotaxis protein
MHNPALEGDVEMPEIETADMLRSFDLAEDMAVQGSEFVVRLPVMVTPATPPPSPVTETSEPTIRAMRVLLVDDSEDMIFATSMLLERSGHDVRTACDGPSAVQTAIDYRPDVVLLDIGLPGLNGYEVAKQLRQHPVLKNVVLVAITGYGQESDRQCSQEAGFDHHLVKPARFEQLQKILASVSEKAIGCPRSGE